MGVAMNDYGYPRLSRHGEAIVNAMCLIGIGAIAALLFVAWFMPTPS